jgi:hypothetical protein
MKQQQGAHQQQGVTQKPLESECAGAQKAALACTSVPLSSLTLPLSLSFAMSPPTTMFFTNCHPAAGAGAAGDNKAETCEELFKAGADTHPLFGST